MHFDVKTLFLDSYSVTSLETTIFRQNGQFLFRFTFLSLGLNSYFITLMGAIVDMYCPHKSKKMWVRTGAEKSGSKIDPY